MLGQKHPPRSGLPFPAARALDTHAPQALDLGEMWAGPVFHNDRAARKIGMFLRELDQLCRLGARTIETGRLRRHREPGRSDLADALVAIPAPFTQGIDPAPRPGRLDTTAPGIARSRVVADRALDLPARGDVRGEVVTARRVEWAALPLERALLVAERERGQSLVHETVLLERRVVPVLGALDDVLHVRDRREAHLGEPLVDH